MSELIAGRESGEREEKISSAVNGSKNVYESKGSRLSKNEKYYFCQ